MKEIIEINKRAMIKKCRSKVQCCVHCGVKMQSNVFALTINNNGDDLVLRKNLWIHLHCTEAFAKSIKKAIKNSQRQLVAWSI